MARIDNLTNYLTDVAAAIKTKKGSQVNIPAANFDIEISNLPSGGTYQTKSITVSTNTTTIVTPDTGYDAITQMTITTSVPTGQMKEYASETAMNNDIANIQEGEVVKVSSSANADTETDNSIHFSNFNSDYTSSSESSVTFSGFEPNFLNDENDFILLRCDSTSQFYAFYYNSSLVKPVVMYVSHESKYLVRFFDISTTNYTDNGYGATGSNYKTNIHKETIHVTANYVNGYVSSYTYDSSDSPVYTGAGDVAGVRFLSSGDIIDTSNNVVFQAPNPIVTFYLKETTMKKLVKEEDTISPEEYVEDVGLTEDILGGEPVPPEPEIQDHYEIEYTEMD